MSIDSTMSDGLKLLEVDECSRLARLCISPGSLSLTSESGERWGHGSLSPRRGLESGEEMGAGGLRLRRIRLARLRGLERIDGLQHLRGLQAVELQDLPGLARVSGAWPGGQMKRISICRCPRLQGIPRCDRPDMQQLARDGLARAACPYFILALDECEAMEALPVEASFVENCLSQNVWRERCRLIVLGCDTFASVGVLARWMHDSDFGSPLFDAALMGLLWQCLIRVISSARLLD